MCNLYSVTRTQEAMRRLFRVHRDLLGNFPGLPAVFPDTMAPVVHVALDGERELSGSVKQQDEGLGISPISGLLAKPVANLK